MSLLLAVEEIQKTFADEPVLRSVSFEIRRGQRLALIGPNGAGKTTLLRILRGELAPDGGRLELAKGATLGFLEQRPSFGPHDTLWRVAQRALQPLLDLQHQAEATAHAISRERDALRLQELTERFERLQEQLHQRQAFQLDHHLERVLQGLGFREPEYQQSVAQLSGGQVNRLMLAALLLESPDIMLLDEPSNHLDLEATEWLEEFLGATRQAFVLVSHDRYFLDRVVDITLELVHGTVVAYPGNFTKYKTLSAERLLVQRRTYQKQADEIARIEDFIRRNHYGQKATQAEDRRRKLERIERVELPREIAAPAMRFPEPSRCGDVVLRVDRLAKRFDQPLFADVSFQLQRGERWGVLGPNGCGKSTLLRCLLGSEQPTSGTIHWGVGVRIGYFDQKLEMVAGDQPAAEAIRSSSRDLNDQQRRDLLAGFGVTGETALQAVNQLSGGERSRVALARLAADEPNVMILDEPTNHLDLWARESLERALLAFDGTLLIVSHDRYFLQQVCTHLLLFEPNRVRTFPGTFEEYRQGRSDRPAAAEARPDVRKGASATSDNGQTTGTARRRRRFPYRKVADIEQEISQREARVAELHAALADPEILRSGPRVKAAHEELQEMTTALQVLYDHWAEAAELNG